MRWMNFEVSPGPLWEYSILLIHFNEKINTSPIMSFSQIPPDWKEESDMDWNQIVKEILNEEPDCILEATHNISVSPE